MNKKRAKEKAPKAQGPTAPSTLLQQQTRIEEQQAALNAEVMRLEGLIVGAPRLALEHRLKNMDMVPPPDVFPSELVSAGDERRMSYGQQHRVRRNRHRNLVFFLVVLCLLMIAITRFIVVFQ